MIVKRPPSQPGWPDIPDPEAAALANIYRRLYLLGFQAERQESQDGEDQNDQHEAPAGKPRRENFPEAVGGSIEPADPEETT